MDEKYKYEYESSLIQMRFFLDYRLKLFNFYLLLNGLLANAMVSETLKEQNREMLAMLAGVVSALLMLAEYRTAKLTHSYRETAIKLSSLLELSLINVNHHSTKEKGVQFSTIFLLLYFLITSSWFYCVWVF